MFEKFKYIILEWLVNIQIKWLNSASCTSCDINLGCFAFYSTLHRVFAGLFTCLHKGFCQRIQLVCWWVVENAIPTIPLVERWPLLFDSIVFSLSDLSATICHKRLEEVVVGVHFHLRKWLTGRCTVVFYGLIHY